MSATIKDIARKLNISPSTVSRALNQKPGISKRTIKKVNALAGKLNYKPNSIAVSLRQLKTHCIGVLVPRISNHFFAEAISGIQQIAARHGYQVLICETKDQEQEEQKMINALNSGRVDGILISMGSEVQRFGHIRTLVKEVPVVLFDRTVNKIDVTCIGAEDYKGAFEVTRHLIESGRKRIVHLMGPKSVEIAQHRLKGYKTAIGKHKIPLDEELIVNCGFGTSKVKPALANLITNHVSFDAVFATNDDLAVEAILTLNEYGLRVPEDVSVAGFGNYPVAKIVRPSLTTVNHKPKQIGIEATTRLIDLIEGNPTVLKKKIASELIVRDST